MFSLFLLLKIWCNFQLNIKKKSAIFLSEYVIFTDKNYV